MKPTGETNVNVSYHVDIVDISFCREIRSILTNPDIWTTVPILKHDKSFLKTSLSN